MSQAITGQSRLFPLYISVDWRHCLRKVIEFKGDLALLSRFNRIFTVYNKGIYHAIRTHRYTIGQFFSSGR